jgi:SAM-dependent methyltransferase
MVATMFPWRSPMNDHSYSFDAELRIWRTPAHDSIAYSDGEEVEHRLLDALKQCHDLSSTSDELRQHIVDWPSEYHFSPLRHALIRPFAISPSDRILELGCGCGAITRYMGETGATVVAVEGSPMRAQIAAERCRDLPNVSIYCDNLSRFSSSLRFDFVTLIGVLEYAPLFVTEPDPVDECLRIARGFLTSRGQLLLAIENQIGLKYFNGCREDHLGRRYFGIHDLYAECQPITFGKRELAARLEAGGFPRQQFCYPFPDYKLPALILSDRAMLDPDLRPVDMLCRTLSRDHAGPGYPNFYENLALPALTRNGLLADTANSFLVLAAPADFADGGAEQEGWLASAYNLDRKSAFAVETRFMRGEDGISVEKIRLAPESATASGDGFFMHHPADTAPYVHGQAYLRSLQRLLARDGTLPELAEWARPWIETLHAQSMRDRHGEALPGHWLDAIPANFIETDTGVLELIDSEWRAAEPVPLDWVLIRGLVNSITACPLSSVLRGMSFRQMIEGCLRNLNFSLPDENDYRRAAELEDRLALMVYGKVRGVPDLARLLEMPIFSYCSPPTLEDENRRLQGEIAAMHGSRSWRLTAPLRAADRWLKQLTRS